MQSALVIAGFKLGKDGFIIRLTSLDEMIEDACEFVGRILDGLGCTMPGALRPVVFAQVGLVVVEGLSRHTKDLGNAIFGFDLGTADAPAGTEAVFWTQVHPGGETVIR